MMTDICQAVWAMAPRYLDLVKHSRYFYESALNVAYIKTIRLWLGHIMLHNVKAGTRC